MLQELPDLLVPGIVKPEELLIIGDETVGRAIILLHQRTRTIVFQSIRSSISNHRPDTIPVGYDALHFGRVHETGRQDQTAYRYCSKQLLLPFCASSRRNNLDYRCAFGESKNWTLLFIAHLVESRQVRQ
jgi:hypothetical protein